MNNSGVNNSTVVALTYDDLDSGNCMWILTEDQANIEHWNVIVLPYCVCISYKHQQMPLEDQFRQAPLLKITILWHHKIAGSILVVLSHGYDLFAFFEFLFNFRFHLL